MTAPRADAVEEARDLARQLTGPAGGVGALVVNRATPSFGDAPDATTLAALGAGHPLVVNHAQLAARATLERGAVAPLAEAVAAPVTWVPLLGDDVHDSGGLERIRSTLFEPAGTAG